MKTTKMKTGKTKTAKTSLRKIITGTIGSEIAEAALVLPIFFMIMLGIYWFGRAFNTYATINHAAREGARLGTVQGCAMCGTPNASADAESNRRSSRISPPGLQPPSRRGLEHCGTGHAPRVRRRERILSESERR